LIQIKVPTELAPSIRVLQAKGEQIMPAETAWVVVGVTVAFLIFAASLAWADYYTHKTH
jgi:hypothetical protein